MLEKRGYCFDAFYPSSLATMVRPSVIALVERFAATVRYNLEGHYNETALRREFKDPLFQALGWDMPNWQGYSEGMKLLPQLPGGPLPHLGEEGRSAA